MSGEQEIPIDDTDAGGTPEDVAGLIVLLWYATLGAVFAGHLLLGKVLGEIFGLTRDFPFHLLVIPVLVLVAGRGIAGTVKDVGIVAAVTAAAGAFAMAVGVIFVGLGENTFIQNAGWGLEHVVELLGWIISVSTSCLACDLACSRLGLQTRPWPPKTLAKGERAWPPYHDPPTPSDELPQWLQR